MGQQVVVEEGKRFSESDIWFAQREYYDKRGIDAWTGDVPFYITSNAYIGGTYAMLVARFIQDWLKQHPDAINETFYAIELGTGSGQFSFYFLKQFEQLQKKLHLENIKFCYVMSDFTENNVKFWQSHNNLLEFVKKGMLDFAVFDVENDAEVHLLESNTVISAKSLSNPLVVVANYLFDSVVSDVFRVQNGQLQESLPRMSTHKKNVKDGKPIKWEEVKVAYDDKPISDNYYGDKLLDDVLTSYKSDLKDSVFFYPSGSLRAINQLMSMSNDKLLLLTSDKGFVDIAELEDEDHPELDFHGSFSVMVNYDAISRYFKQKGGDCFMQCPRDAIVTAAFLLGAKMSDCVEFEFALDQLVSEFSPADFFNMYENIEDQPKRYKIDTLASALSLSRWDPGLYDDVADQISDCIDGADQDLIDYLSRYLHRVADNYYHMPGTNDTIFAVGTFYQEVGEYEDALHYFTKSREYFPSTWEVEFNSGYCQFYLEDYDAAIAYFDKALEHEPKSKETKLWIKDTKAKIAALV